MRRADAPPPGWYPDPTGGPMLWWWDGLDWTRARRPPPASSDLEQVAAAAARSAPAKEGGARRPAKPSRSGMSRQDTEQLLGEVRRIARSEADKAITTATREAKDVAGRLGPLLEEWSGRARRWFRRAAFVGFVLVVAWVVVSGVAQVNLLDWIGEQFDR